jgi:hypothetical protein
MTTPPMIAARFFGFVQVDCGSFRAGDTLFLSVNMEGQRDSRTGSTYLARERELPSSPVCSGASKSLL